MRIWTGVRPAISALVPLLTLLASPRSLAAEPRDLRRTEPLVLGAELGSALLLAGGALLAHAPASCKWCSPPGFDEALHFPAAAHHRRGLAVASHVVSAAVTPGAALLVALLPPLTGSDPDRHAYENVSIIAEAVFFDLALNLTIKKLVARQRPAFYYERGGTSEYAENPSEQNLSFISSDSAGAFTVASATATVAFLRGYDAAPYVAVAGAVLASAAGALRVAADVHWPSDVVVGAVVGSGVGVALPWLLHGRELREPRRRGAQRLLPWIGLSPAILGVGATF